MKAFAFLLCATALAVAGSAAGLGEIQSVYLLPMTAGLDQYLANHLTGEAVLRVVADPKRADAVFTDRLGEEFERRLEELYASQPPAPIAPAAQEGETKGESARQGAQAEPRVRFSSFGRGRGNVFLVEVRTRAVIWSAWEKPKDSTPEELDRAARRLVARLKRALGSR
ncbi:MAG: hypothetical protein RMK57_01370 [Bryobacterales bacterium]|nr:hypothetical protein [Bryobacteraceae bacterium]MDW8353153.1 hypothetical protein [Bryobacterales bacterium]